MEENITKSEAGKSNNKIWIWVIVAVIAILVLFFVFKGAKKGDTGTITPPGDGVGGSADINSLDVGENPDTGVDDFSTLDVSQEDIFP